MPLDESLAQRLLAIVQSECSQDHLTEKRMFGGYGVMLNGNMACGVLGDKLLVRVGPDAHDECIALPHAAPFDFTGKPMKGFLYVHPEGAATTRDLRAWAKRGIAFARSLPKKEPKP